MKMSRNRNKSLVLNTERLCLHTISEKDIDDMIDLLTNSEVAKTFMLPEFKTNEDVVKLFRRILEMSNSEENFVYGIYQESKMIGFLNDVAKVENELEIGYVIHPDKKNNGFATEVLKVVIKELFDMGYCVVRAGAFEGNIASIRVMEKCGMKRTYQDEDIQYRGNVCHCINYEIRK